MNTPRRQPLHLPSHLNMLLIKSASDVPHIFGTSWNVPHIGHSHALDLKGERGSTSFVPREQPGRSSDTILPLTSPCRQRVSHRLEEDEISTLTMSSSGKTSSSSKSGGSSQERSSSRSKDDSSSSKEKDKKDAKPKARNAAELRAREERKYLEGLMDSHAGHLKPIIISLSNSFGRTLKQTAIALALIYFGLHLITPAFLLPHLSALCHSDYPRQSDLIVNHH